MRSRVLAAALLAAGCAAPRARPGARVALDVPFFADETDQCGPSALASLLAYWRLPADPADLRREVYRPALRGSLPVDLLLAARRRGLTARMDAVSLDALKAELDAGRPSVAFLNLGLRRFPMGHFVVVTGYDDARRALIVHSSGERSRLIRYRLFERAWARGARWSLTARP